MEKEVRIRLDIIVKSLHIIEMAPCSSRTVQEIDAPIPSRFTDSAGGAGGLSLSERVPLTMISERWRFCLFVLGVAVAFPKAASVASASRQ